MNYIINSMIIELKILNLFKTIHSRPFFKILFKELSKR